MFGILILIVFLCIMGFVLAFVHNMFEDHELPIGRAILILILTGIISFAVKLMLLQNGVDELSVGLIGIVTNFLVLMFLLKQMAYTTYARAALMSLVYAIIAFIFALGLAYLLSPSG